MVVFMKDKNQITIRKREHLSLAQSPDSKYKVLKSGFKKYRFIHCALPELNFSEVDVATTFLGYHLSCPLIINPISGGEENSKNLNKDLAEVAAEEKIALSLGSLRPALEDEANLDYYRIVLEEVEDIPFIINIGCLQIKDDQEVQKIFNLCDQLDVDAISIHLNPLQEILQPEGGTKFAGVLKSIKRFVEFSAIPVIIKEVGFGLSKSVITKLINAGVKWIDLSGSGGTSWSRIEAQRNNKEKKAVAMEFAEWGIPTSECLGYTSNFPDVNFIASGGIQRGMDFAKALALGSDFTGIAGAIVREWSENGRQGIKKLVKRYRQILKICLFSVGCKNIEQFKRNTKIIKKIC